MAAFAGGGSGWGVVKGTWGQEGSEGGNLTQPARGLILLADGLDKIPT